MRIISLFILFTCASHKPMVTKNKIETDKVIKAAFIDSYGQFKRCYENTLTYESSLKISLWTIFYINKDGNTSEVEITKLDQKIPEKLKSCMVSKILKLKFPKLADVERYRVKQPFNFLPAKSSKYPKIDFE